MITALFQYRVFLVFGISCFFAPVIHIEIPDELLAKGGGYKQDEKYRHTNSNQMSNHFYLLYHLVNFMIFLY